MPWFVVVREGAGANGQEGVGAEVKTAEGGGAGGGGDAGGVVGVAIGAAAVDDVGASAGVVAGVGSGVVVGGAGAYAGDGASAEVEITGIVAVGDVDKAGGVVRVAGGVGAVGAGVRVDDAVGGVVGIVVEIAVAVAGGGVAISGVGIEGAGGVDDVVGVALAVAAVGVGVVVVETRGRRGASNVGGVGLSVVRVEGVRKMLEGRTLRHIGAFRVAMKNGGMVVGWIWWREVRSRAGGLHEIEWGNGVNVEGREDGLVTVAVVAVADVSSAGHVAAGAVTVIMRWPVLGVDIVPAWVVYKLADIVDAGVECAVAVGAAVFAVTGVDVIVRYLVIDAVDGGVMVVGVVGVVLRWFVFDTVVGDVVIVAGNPRLF